MPALLSATAPGALVTQRGVFGYLPGHQDLVRVRASSREVRALEGWLERGLHQARWEMSSGFAPAYSFLTHRFVFRPDNSESALLGVLYASQDSHQRPFPFVAFEPLPTAYWDGQPVELLRWNEPLFSELEALVPDVAALPQLGQVHGRVLAAREPVIVSAEQATEATRREQRRYDNFLAEVTCGELGPAGLGVAICRDLWALLRGTGTRDPRNLRTAIELPLQRPVMARALELRFYLHLCTALLLPAQPTLTLFWKLGGPEAGALLLGFREPTIDVFCALLRRTGPTRGVCYPGRDPALTQLPLPPLPLHEDTPLRVLLDYVEKGGPSRLLTHEAAPSLRER